MTDLEETLQKQKRAAEERSAKRRAESQGLDYIDLISTGTPTEIKAIALVDKETARKALLVPVQIIKKNLVVAAYDPEKKEAKELIENLKKKYNVAVAVTSMAGLKHAWSYYQYVKKAGEAITGEVKINAGRIKEIGDQVKSLEDLTNLIQSFKSPKISKVLEIVLAGAMALKSSDIHLEPTADSSTFRLRIDGILHTITKELGRKIHHSTITRIKLLSNLKLNIKDEPQDGRFTMALPDRDIEIRTSIIPSEYGETGVLRILDPKSLEVELEKLGWRKDDLKIVRQELAKPNGLILNTGPTGSGKTTTLYAFLKQIAKQEVKVITVEDPI